LLPLPAQVGHRQPRADQVPDEKNLGDPNDPINRENAALDRMVKGICRGCQKLRKRPLCQMPPAGAGLGRGLKSAGGLLETRGRQIVSRAPGGWDETIFQSLRSRPEMITS
jgi:hypothetical protein